MAHYKNNEVVNINGSLALVEDQYSPIINEIMFRSIVFLENDMNK